MSFYQELQSLTEPSRYYLLSAPIIENVMARRFDLATYIAFLNQAYHHVRHTIPLLMLAGGRLAPDQMYLQSAIAHYIGEELGHEQWILNDVEACGFDRDSIEHGDAPYHSELLVSFLYDTVTRGNPVGIFGMVQVLEGTSASLAPAVAAIVQDKLSLPDAAMTYLTTHGELDQTHLTHFKRAMERITDRADQRAIAHVAERVYRLYGDIYRDIPETADQLKLGMAA